MRSFLGFDFRTAAVLLLGAPAFVPAASAQTPLATELVASGLNRPLWAGAPEGDPRIFVAEKTGRIKIVVNGAVLATPFLSLVGKISNGSEQGLLGVAFHPNYAQTGWFYVNYTDLNGDTVIARFQVSADPNVAEPTSETLILAQPQPFDNHNGGDLHFGPDGYLYVMLGDGGSANDPGCRAQKLSSRLGKILRYDVDSATPYAIPPDNPFVGVAGAFPEIWHYGVRNPWRVGFDRLTGDLYIGDVGQDAREEISFAPAGMGGLNFGWRVMEGTRCNGLGSCLAGTPACGAPELVPPIYEYSHSPGSKSVTGGFVYRGCAIPSLQGTYFFADYLDDKIRSFIYDTTNGVQNFQDRTAELAPGGGLSIQNIASFGEDGFGELLILDNTGSSQGEVFKIVPAGANAALATARNGGGTNASCYTNQSLPILGNLWRTTIDASLHAGATFVGIVAHTLPSSGTFFGASEVLVDLGSTKLYQAVQTSTGGVATFEGVLPCDAALQGMTAATQAFILGGGIELCNAVDVTLGY
jgi:glucose/arabinose dehydrogenase